MQGGDTCLRASAYVSGQQQKECSSNKFHSQLETGWINKGEINLFDALDIALLDDPSVGARELQPRK